MPVLNYDQLIAAINLHSAAEPSLQSSLVNLVLNYQKTGAIKPGKTFSKQLLDDSEKVFQSLCDVVHRENRPTSLSKIGTEIGLSNRDAEERKRLDKALRYISEELKTAHKVGFVRGQIVEDTAQVNAFQVRWMPREFSLIDGKIVTGKLSRNNEGKWLLAGEEDESDSPDLQELEDQAVVVEEFPDAQEVEELVVTEETQEIDLAPIEAEIQEELLSEEYDDEASEETPEIDIYANLDPAVKDLLLQNFDSDEGHELLDEDEDDSEDDYYIDADDSDISALFDNPETLDEDELSDEE